MTTREAPTHSGSSLVMMLAWLSYALLLNQLLRPVDKS